MALNVVLVTQKQSAKGLLLSWSPMEGVSSFQVLVASRKLAAEELEAAVAKGGTEECSVVKLGADATAIIDDTSPEGDSHFYGVVMNFADGAPRSARLKMTPEGGPAGTPTLSSKGVKKSAAKPAAAPAPAAVESAFKPGAVVRPPSPGPAPVPSAAAGTGTYRVSSIAPAPQAAIASAAAAAANAGAAAVSAGNTGSYKIGAAAAPVARPAVAANPSLARPATTSSAGAAAPAVNTGSYKVNTPGNGAAAAATAPAPKPAEEKPIEKAIEKPAAPPPSKAPSQALLDETVPPPTDFPLEETFPFHMKGGTQTWDGLRLYWERETTALAYEILVSDHQIFGDELGDVLAGKADFTSATAVPPGVRAVIDNITPREARGWYLVLVRGKNGKRTPHEFQIGDAAESGKAVAPFVNPNRTGELRAEIDGMLGDAREQWDRWKREQDVGAKHEARRLVSDALLMYPNHPGATELRAGME